MHDGRIETLNDVLEFYNKPRTGALGETELDPLDLIPQDHWRILWSWSVTHIPGSPCQTFP